MSYGLTPAGFVIKPLPQIISELQASYQGQFGAGIPLDGNSLFGQIIGIHAEREADLWTLGQAIYLSQYPDSATDVSLENVVSLTGQVRLNATFSTVTVTVTGTAGTLVAAGAQVGVTGTAFTFATLTDVTIPLGGSIDVATLATATGPVSAPAGTVTTIVTPIAGWASVTNAAAAIVGRNQEMGAALRTRRATDIVTARAGQVDAIRQAVKQVQGVTFVSVAENRLDTPDGAGRPPHSFEVTVSGGTNHDVGYAIWNSKGGGPNTFGSSSFAITDSDGNAQVMRFSRPTQVPIYVSLALSRNPLYPTNGDAAVLAAILLFGGTFVPGQPVADFPLQMALAAVPGIDDADILFGLAPGPTDDATVVLNANQQAAFDASRIVIT